MPSTLAGHWSLDPVVTFLNHGSFGACPRTVQAAQQAWRDRMEAEPVRFLARELDGHLAEARAVLGAFLGADADDLAFVTNATAAVNTVVRSLRFEPGDELLATDHEYNATLNILRFVAERDGGRVVVVRLPLVPSGPDEVVGRILEGVTDRTRLALVSHGTSPTALVLPIPAIVEALVGRGIDTLVDGAHGPGMLPLDLNRIGAAYYAGNLHKWVCAPKGAGFLHVRRDRRPGIRPLTISHGANAPSDGRSRFRQEFDWQGTLDPTPWLAVPDALHYIAGLAPGGWPEVMARNHALALEARRILAEVLEVETGPVDEMLGSMVALPMPATGPLGGVADPGQSSPLDADPLQNLLFDRFGIEVPIYGWPVPAVERREPARRMIRVSAALYNDAADVVVLADGLRAIASGNVPPVRPRPGAGHGSGERAPRIARSARSSA